MKIAFIGGANVPSQGGIENYVLNLARQLKNKGHDVSIISRGDKKNSTTLDGIEIKQLRIKENILSIFWHNIYATWYICKNSKNIDIVNYQSIFLSFLYEWLPKLKGIKVIHTQHSFAQDNPKHNKKTKWFIGLLYRLSGFVASPIITVSEHNKRLIRRRLKKNATVINCGVNVAKPIKHTDFPTDIDIKPDEFYLTIGRIDPVKNLHVLIKAFLRHPKERPEKLVICGNMNNEYGDFLRKLAGDDERVIFPGVVSGIYKDKLLHLCKAYCLVSSSEGFPIALLEAMAHGKICICSDIPACKEALTEPLGLWCKVNDEESLWNNMHKLESSPKDYEFIKDLVRKRIEENLSWDKISDQYIDYLQNVLGDGQLEHGRKDSCMDKLVKYKTSVSPQH